MAILNICRIVGFCVSWDSVSFCAILCRCRMFPPAPDCQREGPSPICPKTSLSGGWPVWKVCEWPQDPTLDFRIITIHGHGRDPPKRFSAHRGEMLISLRKMNGFGMRPDPPSPFGNPLSCCLILQLRELRAESSGCPLWCQN